MAYDPVLRWQKSPSSNVNQYVVTWTLNGAAAGTTTVPQSATGDSAGYSSDWATSNPAVTLQSGDVVAATVAAVDTVDGLSSPPVAAGPLTIPASAPDSPVNVTLTLV